MTNLPNINELDDIEWYKEEFSKLVHKIVNDEQSIHGPNFQSPFPTAELVYISGLSYQEVIVQGIPDLENLLWRTTTLASAINTHINRKDRILAWISARLSTALAQVNPACLSAYFGREDKLYAMGNRYKGINYLLEIREQYDQEKIKLRKIDENLERVLKLISHRIWNLNGLTEVSNERAR